SSGTPSPNAFTASKVDKQITTLCNIGIGFYRGITLNIPLLVSHSQQRCVPILIYRALVRLSLVSIAYENITLTWSHPRCPECGDYTHAGPNRERVACGNGFDSLHAGRRIVKSTPARNGDTESVNRRTGQRKSHAGCNGFTWWRCPAGRRIAIRNPRVAAASCNSG